MKIDEEGTKGQRDKETKKERDKGIHFSDE
jgi:hypothetical protein